MAKTAAQEWPEAFVKSIDLQTGGLGADALAEALKGELLSGGYEREVGLTADGRRWTLVSEEAPVSTHTPRELDRPVILASGGARHSLP